MAGLTQRFPLIFSQFIGKYQLVATAKNAKQLIAPAISTEVPRRYSSFLSSKPVVDLSQYPEVEVVHNPPEWKYVESLLPAVTVPAPKKKASYPSGWQPPKAFSGSQKYFISRTKNHMIPVYLHTKFRGLRRITVIRLVQGDIWSLEKDIRKVVEASRNGKAVASRVNELSGQIHFHGDHVNLVKDWLLSKGY